MRYLLAAFLLVSATATTTASQQGSAAEYEVTFDATWSALTHPGAHATGAHFSRLVGASHSDALTLWEPGGLASPGIEWMAETGSTEILASEIDGAIAAGLAGDLALGASALVSSPGVTRSRFTVTAAHPLVSLVSMIGPSPDWFVGVNGIDLSDSDGLWRDDVVVQLFAYDCGTDSGLHFVWPNQNTEPQEPIALMEKGPFFADTPLGTFTFARIQSVQPYGCGVNPAGSVTIDAGLPAPGSTVELSLTDPTGAFPAPAITALFFSLVPDASFPCGTLVPDFGMTGIGSPGEILLAAPVVAWVDGPPWSGSPAPISVAIPAGIAAPWTVYAQGFLVEPGGRVGATSGVEFLIGD